MPTIDRILQMQQQGMSDTDIINTLRNEGVSPKDINDSLSQAKIKIAVSQEPQEFSGYQESQTNAPEQQYAPEQYAQPYPQEQYQQTPQYAPEQYAQDGYYMPEQPQVSMETISDIAERIISEKISEINKKIKPVLEFKNKTEEDIQDLKERVKRIESTIDNLQKAVINKIGEFGQSTALVHKDLENLHGTVSKLMNPLVDNYNELKKINEKHKPEHRKK